MSVRSMVLMGSVIYAGSIFLTSFVQETFLFVFLLFGVLRSLGMSFVYPVLMSYAVELFPERSGFASGMMTGGFGLGAMIWAPLATYIYQTTGDITRVFLVFGLLFGAIMIPLTFLLTDPAGAALSKAGQGGGREKAGQEKAGQEKADQGKADQGKAGQAVSPAGAPAVALYDVNRKQMLGIPLFYVMFVGLTLAMSCGNLLVNQASPIMRNLFGFTAQGAALIVSVSSISNVMGRAICGPASDRFGKSQVALGLLLLTTAMMICMTLVRQQLFFTVCMMLVVFGYGGLASLVPPLTRELFGSKNFAGNYTLIYFTYALASLAGPLVGTGILERTASYSAEFGYGAAIAAAGSVALWIIVRMVSSPPSKPLREMKP
jgi:OFA family oxalate/formate antiporter-like MFS transporter